ncbi:hypothetical protein JYU34_012142 [Plutella xylostella]|uniref:Uncharacterized protein n=1 Tax=Plutella xylostella TaxID=51655 RepID=A0ABQ7QEH1_PLUXY|nr:hypothetical protein JYU34_012142 [Plutella xylostella]
MPVKFIPDHKESTEMVIPVSKETYFNTKWKGPGRVLCEYDMLFHPPEYDPRAARCDRRRPQITWENIWEQEYPKGIPSTTQLNYGRPKWPILDKIEKLHSRAQVSLQSPGTHVPGVLRWAELLRGGKTTCADA